MSLHLENSYIGNSTIFLYFSWYPLLSVCEFATVPGVYILLSLQEQELHSFSLGQRCTHSVAHSLERFKPMFCHYIMARSLLNWKKHKQGI